LIVNNEEKTLVGYNDAVKKKPGGAGGPAKGIGRSDNQFERGKNKTKDAEKGKCGRCGGQLEGGVCHFRKPPNKARCPQAEGRR